MWPVVKRKAMEADPQMTQVLELSCNEFNIKLILYENRGENRQNFKRFGVKKIIKRTI